MKWEISSLEIREYTYMVGSTPHLATAREGYIKGVNLSKFSFRVETLGKPGKTLPKPMIQVCRLG